MDDEIIKLKPFIKNYLWGGERLKSYGKKSDDIIAESWEVSTHDNGVSLVDSGIYKGMKLDEFIKLNPNFVNGQKDLPILIKYIDANKDLSVQVHPDDAYAKKYENQNGKTEIWFVIEANDNAFVYCGLKKEITKEELKKKIIDGTVTDVLNKVYTKPGDVFLIEPGTIHSIGSGNLILEVQKNSDVTYRVFDYNRKDKNGNLRKLDVDKAIDVINTKAILNMDQSSACKYFACELYNIDTELELKRSENYQIINFIEGAGVIDNLEFRKGDTFLIQANHKGCLIKGKCRFVVTKQK